MTEPFDPRRTPDEAPATAEPSLVLPSPDEPRPHDASQPPAPESSVPDAPAPAAPDGPDGPESQEDSTLSDVRATLAHLISETEKHHHRATHRESVIDNLHAELEKLRGGERRGVVRPLLVAVARLRDDLVRQSLTLPDDFDAVRAQRLLDSFADSIEITLEDFGVAVFSPSVGDAFEVRQHKAVSSQPTSDLASVRTVASVVKEGYHDIEAGAVLAQAEVTVFVSEPVRPPDADHAAPPAATIPAPEAPPRDEAFTEAATGQPASATTTDLEK